MHNKLNKLFILFVEREILKLLIYKTLSIILQIKKLKEWNKDSELILLD